MIKPDATSKGYTGAILDQIIKAGVLFVRILPLRLVKMRFMEVIATKTQQLREISSFLN